jgi:hypothetical protein
MEKYFHILLSHLREKREGQQRLHGISIRQESEKNKAVNFRSFQEMWQILPQLVKFCQYLND